MKDETPDERRARLRKSQRQFVARQKAEGRVSVRFWAKPHHIPMFKTYRDNLEKAESLGIDLTKPIRSQIKLSK